MGMFHIVLWVNRELLLCQKYENKSWSTAYKAIGQEVYTGRNKITIRYNSGQYGTTNK
jgi:hypothetical protein